MIADLPATVSVFFAYIIIHPKVAKVELSALSIYYLPMAACLKYNTPFQQIIIAKG